MWDELTEYTAALFPNPGFAFVDIHMALIAAANGDRARLDARVEGLNAKIAKGAFPAGGVVPTVCQALYAFADGDHRSCVNLLEPVAHDVVRMGGSHAQREVIEDTLLLALLNSGETGKGRALLDRRLHRRPSVRDSAWRVRAEQV